MHSDFTLTKLRDDHTHIITAQSGPVTLVILCHSH